MLRGLRAVTGQNLSGRKVLGLASLALGGVVLVCIVVLFFFPEAVLRGYVEGRITKGFSASHPGYSIRISGMHFNMMKNRISCDSVMLTRNDSSFSCRIAALSVDGVYWPGILGGSPRGLAGSVIEAGDADMTLQKSGYGLRCGPVRMSVPDSEIVVEGIEIHPSVNDEEFFAGSRFRRTRIVMGTRRCRLSGLACVGVLQGENLHARSIQLEDVSVDVLINKDKPSVDDVPGPRMPGEVLSSMKDTVGLDSLIITDCRLKYNERFAMVRNPATLTFNGVQILVTGIASHAGRGADMGVQARGVLAGGGTMNVVMSIPLSGQPCSLRYSGSLSAMDLSKLNPWVEPSDGTRIKTGMLKSAAFDIDVNAGSATGNVHAVYENLIITSINSRTGSESGMMDRLSSWIARNVKIRRTNTPDRSGAMKIGTVKYVRKRSDPFFGFAWFALRSGVGDIVGF